MKKTLPTIIPNIDLTKDLDPILYRHPAYMRETRDFFMLLLENGDLQNVNYLKELDRLHGQGAGSQTIQALRQRKEMLKTIHNKDSIWSKDNLRKAPEFKMTTDFNLMKAYNHRKFGEGVDAYSKSHWDLFIEEYPQFDKEYGYETKDDSDVAVLFRKYSLCQTMEQWLDTYKYQCEKWNRPITQEGLEEFAKTKMFWTVREYQPSDSWYIANSNSILITHQMRLGKTGIVSTALWNKQDIHNINPYMKNKQVKSGIIVAPKGTIKSWEDSVNLWTYGNVKAKMWSADLKKKEQEQIINEWINGDIEYIITNYDFFVNRQDLIRKKGKVDYLIIDEAHFLVSRGETGTMPLSSKRSNVLLDYRIDYIRDVMLLTGTPSMKKEYELLSLYYFMYPNNRNEEFAIRTNRSFKYNNFPTNNFKWFFERFVQITQTPSRENGFEFKTKNKDTYDALMKELSLLHRIHRTTSEEIQNKGEHIHEDVTIDLTTSQLKLYDSISAMIQTMFLNTDNPLVRDTLLRQLAVDQRLLKPNFMKAVDRLISNSKITDSYIYESTEHIFDQEEKEEKIKTLKLRRDSAINFLGKIWPNWKEMEEATIKKEIEGKLDKKYSFNKIGAKTQWLLNWFKENKQRIKSGAGDPVVVFSQFTSYLYLIKPELEKMGFKVEMLVGSGPESKDRAKKEKDFQNGLTDIMLANIAANREGVTLHRSNQAIFMDRVFSNKDMMQVTERINNPDSIDIKSTLFIMANDTIDTKVKEFNEMYDNNTRYMNESIMSDITGSGANNAKELFEAYLAQNLEL